MPWQRPGNSQPFLRRMSPDTAGSPATRRRRAQHVASLPSANPASHGRPRSQTSRPVLRRSHEHHRDLQARRDAAIPTAAANRDQDRYIMITFPTSQIQNADLSHGVVDPPRRRSRKCTFTISTCAPIIIAQGGHLRSQRPVRARQRRRPTHSWVSAAISQFVCRAQRCYEADEGRLSLFALSFVHHHVKETCKWIMQSVVRQPRPFSTVHWS